MALVSFQSVQKNYGALSAIDHVSFDINEGDFFALLGPNGAGKTTLLSILTGLQRASSGSVLVQGHDVVEDYQAARRLIGSVPQELVFDPFFTVRETLVFQSGYYGIRHNDDWIDELLTSLHLQDKANVNSRQLSGGMKRRLMVAQALVHRPPLIVLDEPTAGVDVELRRELWKFIRALNAQGHTILLTTHYLQEAEELANRIAMMKEGRIVTLADKTTLMQSYTASTLKLRTSSDIALVLSTLDTQRSDKVVRDGAWQCISIRSSRDVETLLSILHGVGVIIDDMVIDSADLESVFLQVMHRP